MLHTVILGPHIDLHVGIHGSLKKDPPNGVSFYQRGCRHHFILDCEPSEPEEHSPFEHPHLGELVEFGPGPQVAHTARWPVVGRRSWVTDMDDFGYPLLLGRYAMNPSLESKGGTSWNEDVARRARPRAANMLAAYAHPSCKAILFRTQHALETAETWLRLLGLEEEGKAFLEKSKILYPAQRPTLLPSAVRQKWSGHKPLRVLFVGNDYQAKNGRLALRIFGKLRSSHPGVKLTYVGFVPEQDHKLADEVDFRGHVSRQEVLSLFKDAHILFHPTKNESFGMVLLEAAASGLAVVTARGPGLEHIDELFTADQALLVDRSEVSPEEEEPLFEEHLRTLLECPEKARSMAFSSYESATSGKLSLDARNELLGEIYSEALAKPAPAGFSLGELPHPGAGELRLESGRVSAGQKSFRAAHEISKLNFYIDGANLPPDFTSARDPRASNSDNRPPA